MSNYESKYEAKDSSRSLKAFPHETAPLQQMQMLIELKPTPFRNLPRHGLSFTRSLSKDQPSSSSLYIKHAVDEWSPFRQMGSTLTPVIGT